MMRNPEPRDGEESSQDRTKNLQSGTHTTQYMASRILRDKNVPNRNPRNTTSSSNGANTLVTVRTEKNRCAWPSPDFNKGKTASIVPEPWSFDAEAAEEVVAAVDDAAAEDDTAADEAAEDDAETSDTPPTLLLTPLTTSCAPPLCVNAWNACAPTSIAVAVNPMEKKTIT